jgi:triphosphoribosyl-dephospho-CoA synthase CitG
MMGKVCLEIAQTAIRAMLYEVSATPKPGLVDQDNCGAHSDMNYLTFMDSCSALASCMQTMAGIGMEHKGNLTSLLAPLRKRGIKGEQEMFKATGGVNTHKGCIYSLGLSCGIAGQLLAQGEELTTLNITTALSEMTVGVVERELKSLPQQEKGKKLTAGERVYLQYGVSGIRGEIENGCPALTTSDTSFFSVALQRGANSNDAAVYSLINIMSVLTDTNILHRHDDLVLAEVKQMATTALSLGSVFTSEGKKYIQQMDRDLSARNISPGGAADLLALNIAFHFWEQQEFF